jgi:hypothetical protein
VRVVVPHHVADHLGALAVFGVGREVLLPHRIEDAALDRLQAVADVREGAGRDDRQRVVEVPDLRRLVERDGLGLATARAARAGIRDVSAAVRVIEQRRAALLPLGQSGCPPTGQG